MNEEEFTQHRNSLATRIAEKPKKLTNRAQLLWEEIMSRQVKFNRTKLELTELESITHEDTVKFFQVKHNKVMFIQQREDVQYLIYCT